MMRFHLDEYVDHAVAGGLRQRGIDVTTANDAGLIQASDEAHLEYCLREKRVIITHDQDFLRLQAAGREHCGIAYCRRGSRTINEIVSGLLLIHDCLTPDEMMGQIEFL
jgi:predicted nuclease of predicted toxin-antitoxin system